MQVTAQHRDGVTVLYPKGKITIGAGDVALREAIGGALEAGAKNILVNLKDVTTADSSGIGEMVAAYTTVTKAGGKLMLCELPSKVSDVLQITQLFTIFDIHDSEDEAIEAF